MTYLAVKNKNLLLSLLSEGGQAQRLQNRLSEAETKLGRRDGIIKDLELATIEARSTNKALRVAASLEKKNAKTTNNSLEEAKVENRILQVEVRNLESKLIAKDEELRRRETEFEAERDAIRLEGVGDCAEIIPIVLPNLDMRPIYAAIRFCKGEI